MNTVQISKQAPVVGEFDVVVCGGGPAGFVAALAAARQGAKTALVERFGFLGGMATAGLVAPLSVFTYNGEQVIGGMPWEFIKRLEAMGGAYIEKPLGNIAFDAELYKLCMQQMVLEAGVTLFMNSYLSGCVCNNGTIDAIVIENKNGTEAIRSKVFVDTTGDADLAHLANVPMQPMNGDALQPMSMYFELAGVDTESPMVKEAMHHNKQGVNCHCLPMREKMIEMSKTEKMPMFGGPWFCTMLHDGLIAINVTRTPGNACDNRDYTRAECRLREDVFTITDILRRTFPEFKDCYVVATSTQAGVRETRRVVGVHTITADEYLNAVQYDDSIARGAHPIDIHSNNPADQVANFLEKPAYVPYRALEIPGYPNLLVAGRCLSADRQAFASLRVQASCMGTGQAAGLAAAQAALDGKPVQDVDVKALQTKLRELGTPV